MSFFTLVRREMYGSLNRLIVISALGGISTAAILTAINSGAQAADSGKVSLWPAALFIVALFLFIKTQHYILITATAEIEAIIHKLRLRLMDHVRHSELLPLEAIGRGEIVGAITKETATLTQMSNTLAFAAQGAVLIFFVAMYVAYLSLLAFALSVIILGIAAVLFHAKSRQLRMASHEASNLEHRLFDRLMDLLNGFKEVRLNSARSDTLFNDIVEMSRVAANIKIRPERNLPANGVLAKRAVRIARRYSVRGPDFQRRDGSRNRHEDDNGSRVCRRYVFWLGSGDTHFERREYGSGQHRATGG